MRIAIFSEIYSPHIGGCVSLTSDLMDALMAEGNDVLVVASSPKVSGFDMNDNVLLCPAVRYPGNPYGFSFTKDRLSDLVTYIENFKPDVIQINSISPIGMAALDISSRLDIPCVFYINESYRDGKKTKPLTMFSNMRTRSNFKALANESDIVVGVSPAIQTYLDQLKIMRKVLISPPAVNTEFFDSNKVLPVRKSRIRDHLKLNDASFIAVFSGFLTEDKKLGEMLNNWSRHFSHNKGIKLLIVGDGPSKSYLTTLAKDISIQNQVIFTGAVRRDRIPSLYSVCDVFVSSCDTDTTCISMLEAISCGLPAIIPANSPNLFQLEEGVTGFSYRDFNELVKYVRKFNELDEQGRKILRNLVRKNAMKNKATNYAKRMLSLYRRAMQVHFFHNSSQKDDEVSEIDVFEDEMIDISRHNEDE